MKNLFSLFLFSCLLFSCNQKSPEQAQQEAALAQYNKNAQVVHALFDALEKEDLEAAASFFAEEATFNPPAYEGEVFNKTQILENYRGFMQLLSNIKATERDFYPSVDANFIPDGGVRIYATWTADLGDNPMQGLKAYEVFTFNEQNKIIEVDEYMDVSGFLNKVSALMPE